MSQPAKAQEPSMEEILASIRRIIADDEAAKPAAAPPAPSPAVAAVAEKPAPAPRPVPPPPRPVAPAPVAETKPVAPPAPPPAADILDLTEAMAAPAPAPSNFRRIDGQSDVVFSDRPLDAAPPPEPAVRAVEEARKQFVSMPDRALLSANTANAVDNAFNSLAHTVLGNNARTLEDLVKEMLRPMLKSWLDDNLPGLVDRIVRAEIERVSRGR
jgi:cell pole-organizing protein PopZ